MNNSSYGYILCSTLYVTYNKKFLLLKHPKLQKWVPPGGKIEPNEMPEDAALRECFEETGLQVKLFGGTSPLVNGLVNCHGMEYNHATENSLSHLDFIYFAKANPDAKGNFPDLKKEVHWFLIEDIYCLDTFSSVPKWCEFFLKNMLT